MEIREIVKEYVASVDELTVKARISKIKDGGDQPYLWEISHHYKPTEKAGGVYYPSAVVSRTLEEAEMNLMAYLEGFTDIGVVENENY